MDCTKMHKALAENPQKLDKVKQVLLNPSLIEALLEALSRAFSRYLSIMSLASAMLVGCPHLSDEASVRLLPWL